MHRAIKMMVAGLALAGAISFGEVEAKMLRVNIDLNPPALSPIEFAENTANRIVTDMYEGFTRMTLDGNIPALAESWEPLADAPGYRFHLRKGVKFHSGNEFTAKDVKATLEALLTPGRVVGLSAPYAGGIVGAEDMKQGKATELAGVTIVDDYTVDIRLTKVDVVFPIAPIFFFDSQWVSQQQPDWATKASAGTGPFKLKTWRQGEYVEVERHADYWGNKAKLEGVRYLIIPSGDTVFSQFDAGELDVADLQDSMFARALRDPAYAEDIVRGPRNAVWYMGMNAGRYEPFKDKRVREAISLAIDRKAVIKSLFNGAAFEIRGLVPTGTGAYTNDLPEIVYDPERAKKLLADAGYPGGQGMAPLELTGWPVLKDQLTYYASQLNAVLGMQVTPKVIERITWIKDANAGELAFFPSRWTGDHLDPSQYLGDLFASTGPYNRSRWKNAEYDGLIAKALSTPDEKARFDIYRAAEKILMDDWATFPLPIPETMGLKKPNVKDVSTSPFGFLEIRNAVIE